MFDGRTRERHGGHKCIDGRDELLFVIFTHSVWMKHGFRLDQHLDSHMN